MKFVSMPLFLIRVNELHVRETKYQCPYVDILIAYQISKYDPLSPIYLNSCSYRANEDSDTAIESFSFTVYNF